MRWLQAATPEQLAFERIDSAGRESQLALYRRLLESAAGPGRPDR